MRLGIGGFGEISEFGETGALFTGHQPTTVRHKLPIISFDTILTHNGFMAQKTTGHQPRLVTCKAKRKQRIGQPQMTDTGPIFGEHFIYTSYK